MSRWVFIAAGCAVGGALAGFGAAHLLDHGLIGRYASPGPVLVSADERTITASEGACDQGSLDVTETPETVTVRMYVVQGIMFAPGSCAIEIFSARLKAPLGNRQLIDGVTGAKIPWFHGVSMLRPAFLPAGFEHRYDAAFVGSDTVAGATAGSTQVYAQGDDYGESIWISQIDGGRWQAPPGVRAIPITVHREPGLAIAGEVEWTQGGQLFMIQSLSYPYATLPTATLLAIADSMGTRQ